MIPIHLKLKNFFSYQDAALDFRGLHTACICGSNGSGKSSLLEAITWAVWGKSRAGLEDEVIHSGMVDARVDFTFSSNQQTYRVIRGRSRGQGGNLEFQLETNQGFISLTGKGLKATQDIIVSYLKLDYETFINSAYLRQGQADAFMLRKPSDRKQVLAGLLKLDQYEELAEQAKVEARQFQGQEKHIEQSLESLVLTLHQRESFTLELERVETIIDELQLTQKQLGEQLTILKEQQNLRHGWQQNLEVRQQQHQSLQQEGDRLNQEISQATTKQTQLQSLLDQGTEINSKYQEFLQLQINQENLEQKYYKFQEAQRQRDQLQQQWQHQINDLKLQIGQTRHELDLLSNEEAEIQEILQTKPAVLEAMEKLRGLRQRLKEIDQLQSTVSPLIKRKVELEKMIALETAKLQAELRQSQTNQSKLQQKYAGAEALREQFLDVDNQIQNLDKKRIYQQRVQEKIQKSQATLTGYQQEVKSHTRRQQELVTKIATLINHSSATLTVEDSAALPVNDAAALSEHGLVCPLCESELSEHDHQRVIAKTRAEEAQLQEQIWHLQEQETITQRELQDLQKEGKTIQQELHGYEQLLGKQGQLEAQLEAIDESYSQLQQITKTSKELELALASNNYALDLQQELGQIDNHINNLNYDEQTHALLRGEVDKGRSAENRFFRLEEASKKQTKIVARKPQLLEKLEQSNTTLLQWMSEAPESSRDSERNRTIDHPLQLQIQELDQQIQVINYDRPTHNQLNQAVKTEQVWLFRHQELQRCEAEYPQVRDRLQQLQQSSLKLSHQQQLVVQQIEEFRSNLSATPDPQNQIREIDQKIHQQQSQLHQQLATLGGWQQQLKNLDQLQEKYTQAQAELKEIQQQAKIYEELAKAFGKNGIQLMIIENVLPQLEAQTNQILSRLTANQLHVQIVTQKPGGTKRNTKMIDTLDIIIADAGGTRPYETYSGGEAFRINFAIRLALARILAQRAGTSLQMLIVDEGFGTQDADGCNHLIAAINAIASDFACILTVTHMPQFKEAFQTRIEVRKTPQGSQVYIAT